MVVKSVRGRRCYVYIRVPTNVRRDDLTDALRDVGSSKVITCQGGDAVVRCSPEDRDAVTQNVGSRWPGSEPVRTSGTLRTLRDDYPRLRVPQKRRR